MKIHESDMYIMWHDLTYKVENARYFLE